MGKRELLLVICFVVIGVVVYQATAPPANPNDRSFSFARLIEAARREVSGNRAHSERTATAAHRLDPEVGELRIVGNIAEVEITGEDRPDIDSALRISSAAYNDAEAKQYADETQLIIDPAGASIAFRVKYPEGRHTGRQRAFLVLKVPSRMRVRIEPGPGKVTIGNVAAVETMQSRGATTIKNVAGRVSLDHRGGPVTIDQIEALKFSGRNTELKVSGVRTDASIRLEGGELSGSQLAGPVDVDARNVDVVLSKLDASRGPIRVNVNGGSARLDGVKADTRVDGRNAELDVTIGASAPITVYNDGGNVALTLPTSGYRLDALVTGGRITPVGTTFEKLGLTSSTSEPPNPEERASGAVNGGGPTITIRATRGDVTLR